MDQVPSKEAADLRPRAGRHVRRVVHGRVRELVGVRARGPARVERVPGLHGRAYYGEPRRRLL